MLARLFQLPSITRCLGLSNERNNRGSKDPTVAPKINLSCWSHVRCSGFWVRTLLMKVVGGGDGENS